MKLKNASNLKYGEQKKSIIMQASSSVKRISIFEYFSNDYGQFRAGVVMTGANVHTLLCTHLCIQDCAHKQAIDTVRVHSLVSV